ncbi:MAG: hypothetical protein SNJ67_05200, partial [Chloracidobacterium sp.]
GLLSVVWLVVGWLALPAPALAFSDPPPEGWWESLRETLDVIRLLVIFVLGGLMLSGLAAVSLWVRAVCPAAMPVLDRMAAERSGWLQLFVGACNGVLTVAAVAGLARLGPFKLVAFSLMGCALTLMLFGLAAQLPLLGRRVLAQSRLDGSALAAFGVGTGLALVMFFVPLVGQLYWLGLLLQSFGLALLWLFRRRTPQVAEPDLTAPLMTPEAFTGDVRRL